MRLTEHVFKYLQKVNYPLRLSKLRRSQLVTDLGCLPRLVLYRSLSPTGSLPAACWGAQQPSWLAAEGNCFFLGLLMCAKTFGYTSRDFCFSDFCFITSGFLYCFPTIKTKKILTLMLQTTKITRNRNPFSQSYQKS